MTNSRRTRYNWCQGPAVEKHWSTLLFYFKSSPCLQPTFTRRTRRKQRGNLQNSIFCFPVTTATCVFVCVTTPPPPKKRKLLPPHCASKHWEAIKTQDWHLGMAHHTKHGHEEGNRWAVGVETERKSAGILSYIILGGASRCSSWDTHSVHPHNPDLTLIYFLSPRGSPHTWRTVCTWRCVTVLTVLHDDETTGQAAETVGGKGKSWTIYYPEVWKE